jgi:hypothetical protein
VFEQEHGIADGAGAPLIDKIILQLQGSLMSDASKPAEREWRRA